MQPWRPLNGGIINIQTPGRTDQDQCITSILNPVFTVTVVPVSACKLLQTAFELTTTVPVLMITSVLASGTRLQLQLAAFSQALLTAPLQKLAKPSVKTVLLFPSTTHRYWYPFHEEGALRICNVAVAAPV